MARDSMSTKHPMEEQQLLKRKREIDALAAGVTDNDRSIANLVLIVTEYNDKKKMINGLLGLLKETTNILECDYCGVYEDFWTASRHCDKCHSDMSICSPCFDDLSLFSDNVCVSCLDDLISMRRITANKQDNVVQQKKKQKKNS